MNLPSHLSEEQVTHKGFLPVVRLVLLHLLILVHVPLLQLLLGLLLPLRLSRLGG